MSGVLLLSGEYKLDDEVWAEVHDSAKDMISHMVVVDPSQRWTAKELLKHKWFDVSASPHAPSEHTNSADSAADQPLQLGSTTCDNHRC